MESTKDCDKLFGSLKTLRDLHKSDMTDETYERMLNGNYDKLDENMTTQVIVRYRLVTKDRVFKVLTIKNKLSYYNHQLCNFWRGVFGRHRS